MSEDQNPEHALEGESFAAYQAKRESYADRSGVSFPWTRPADAPNPETGDEG